MKKYILPDRAEFREVSTEGPWLPAEIPGSVHTDLLKVGRIPDPFVGDHELAVQWVAERDWEYRVRFDVAPALLEYDRVFLVCDGLDTLADVSFNRQALGCTDNMFRQYRWDITPWVQAGHNEVHVRFTSTVRYMLERQREEPLVGPTQAIPGGSHVRKAPSHFGWDWGPQLPPVGIWRPMRLEAYTTARLADVHIRQQHVEGQVTLYARIALERWQSADLEVTFQVVSPKGVHQETSVTVGAEENVADLRVEIAEPELWWPNGYGDQPLYEVTVLVKQEEHEIDRETYRIGLRDLTLKQEPDAFGTSFTFVINGVPVFAKGANWIPADSFPVRISDAHLKHLIRSAAAANMNMLRVWGGGLYEDERFYELCDRYGILVWQDFIFSCSVYPADEAFFENVRQEAIQNIKRLRHHPSLALWCGNNEMEWGWVDWGWAERMDPKYKEAYDRMFHHMLPQLCATYDPDRPYWPSSPSSGMPFQEPNSVRVGDTHNWEVWHGGYPFEHYRNHPSRFVSEFGFQSLPPIETIKTYAAPKDWNMTSYIMEHHQRNAAGNGKIVTYMTKYFRLPKDFPSLVYLSQVLQAESVRTGVEYWRRNRTCTAGTLYWQLNDCWPVISWSSIDYFGRWKALHYVARRIYAPVLLSAELRSQEAKETYLFQPRPRPIVDLYLTNDRTEVWQGRVRWSLEDMTGGVLTHGVFDVTVDPLSAIRVGTLDFADQVGRENEREVVLVYELLEDEESVSLGVLPFVPDKHLELMDPGCTAVVSQVPGGFEIEISSKALARYVWLSLEDWEGDYGQFSDNYFDLPAGRSHRVFLELAELRDVNAVSAALRIRSLKDSYV